MIYLPASKSPCRTEVNQSNLLLFSVSFGLICLLDMMVFKKTVVRWIKMYQFKRELSKLVMLNPSLPLLLLSALHFSIWEMLCYSVREARLGLWNVRFRSFSKQVKLQRCLCWVLLNSLTQRLFRQWSCSGTCSYSPKYHRGASWSIKVQWVSAGTDSCNV